MAERTPARVGERVVLITGSTGALGRTVSATFVAEGVRLALGGRDAARLEALAFDLGLDATRWVPAVGDIRTADGATAAVTSVIDRFGRVDALVHLVGGWSGGATVVELDPDELGAMIDQHVWTTLHITRAVLPPMLERGWGRIVAVTTPFATDPSPRGAPYAVAKAAQEALIRTVAREVSDRGVTANVIVVRKVDTEHARELEPSPKNAAWTTPEEIAATVRYLCSDDAAAISGARVALDGRH